MGSMPVYAAPDEGGEPRERYVRNEDPFAPVPEALLYDAEVSADAVRVYGVLRRHGDSPENCYPSHRRIADLIGRSPRSINGWVRELELTGWIERIPRVTVLGDPDSNGYRVFLSRRGVRADERGGVRANQEGPSALAGATKESQLKESQLERNTSRDERAEAVARFDEHFWPTYPARNGKKLDKRKAVDQWVKLSIEEQRAAVKGARNYAASGQLPKDAHRWLRDRSWEDWQTPASAPTSNGNGRGGGTTADYMTEAMLAYEEGR